MTTIALEWKIQISCGLFIGVVISLTEVFLTWINTSIQLQVAQT